MVARDSEVHENEIQCYLHPMSPTTGEAWMKAEVSFKELKVIHRDDSSKHGNVSVEV